MCRQERVISHHPADRLEAAYPPRDAAAAHMRRALRAYLAGRPLDERTVSEVVLAADEAFINAVSHSGADGPVRIRAWVTGDEALVEVHDGGRGFAYAGRRARQKPDALVPSGRGFFLIEHVMDEVSVLSGRGGTTVRMVRRLPDRRPG